MIFEFSGYKVDVEVERTRAFYEQAEPVSKGCSCAGCRNFEQAADLLPQPVRAFFSNLGIDMKKACECYVNCRREDGSLFYGGFYHVYGTILHGSSAWVNINENMKYWNEELTFPVSENFHVSFQDGIDLLEDKFPRPVLQLEFSADIPWALKEENPY